MTPVYVNRYHYGNRGVDDDDYDENDDDDGGGGGGGDDDDDDDDDDIHWILKLKCTKMIKNMSERVKGHLRNIKNNKNNKIKIVFFFVF